MLSKKLFQSRHFVSVESGFGLIELLVSISVMIIVTTVILARHDTYNSTTMLRGQAYDLALTIRELQLLAVGSTRVNTGFRNSYGLLFSTANSGSYTVFKDDSGNHYYDTGEEFGPQGRFDNRFEIDDIRVIGTGADAGSIETIAVFFKRPNFDARFYKAEYDEISNGIDGIEIDLRLKGTTGTGPGELRTVEITKAGQITVKNI